MPGVPEDLIRRLRDGKAALRLARRSESLEEKLRDIVRAQRMYVEIVRTRRALKPWEQPWNILSDVRDAIIIGDGMVERGSVSVTASSSHWVRPQPRWIPTP
jgi:hypothetical protein